MQNLPKGIKHPKNRYFFYYTEKGLFCQESDSAAHVEKNCIFSKKLCTMNHRKRLLSGSVEKSRFHRNGKRGILDISGGFWYDIHGQYSGQMQTEIVLLVHSRTQTAVQEVKNK